MLKNISMLRPLLLLLSVFAAGQIMALEKITASELVSICQAKTKQAQCEMYIQGFLAGGKFKRADKEPTLSFQDKALKSRVGGRLNDAEYNYCIPEQTTIENLATLIASESNAQSLPAEKLMENVLNKHFQCLQ